MRKKIISVLLSIVCISTMLTGCASGTNGGIKSKSKESTEVESKTSDHEEIVMNAPYSNMSYFVDVLHKKYPEINLKVIPYNGANTTAYVKGMLKSGNIPDIYFTTYYNPGKEKVSEQLLDLSKYDFLDNYVPARLNDVTVEGSVFMLPLAYNCLGITYNKTLLDKNGWKLPKSLEEMEELAPKVKKAGYNFALTQLQYPGFGFQYICNILSTGYLSTLNGIRWQNDFLSGKTTLKDSPEMMKSMNLLKRWRKDGLLNADGDPSNDEHTMNQMAEGKTLFLLGNSNDIKENTSVKTTDEFRIMPYLSVDGDQDVYMLNESRYVGLNKKLGEKGNEQKLQDAEHVLEVISTVEGMKSLKPSQSKSVIYPLKDATVGKDSYYADVLEDLNAGHTAPFIYSGWENVAATIGQTMISYIRGKATFDEVVSSFDANQKMITNDEAVTYTTATETIGLDDCAKIVGISFAQKTGADLALISENKWIYSTEIDELNRDGVSGALFALPIRDEEIVSILPTGWAGTIQTVTLTGARIKELAQSGYDKDGTGETYPYALVTKKGFKIDDNTTYKVAICGATEEVQKEGNIQDSGIVGLDAAKEYFSQFKTLSKKDIVWE